MKYLIYCRKSTDTEDKQVLSLDSQENELREIALKENFEIVKTLRESKSAKEPGRPIFNEMIKMLSSGKADAILCWKIDRLTRNPVDGGQIQWLLQTNKIKCIRTFEKSYFPNDNVLLMSIEQAMANQYIRDLSVNVKRGNREKLARGEWPNHAPFGYLNDKATKTIVVDKTKAKYVQRAYSLYLTGSYGFRDIARILYEEGLRTASGRKVLISHIQRILNNPFYSGIMVRDGKYYNGNHKLIISKSDFDKAQELLADRSRPRLKKLFFPLRGFMKCEVCGCALTASLKKGHHYYYCTNRKEKCDEHKTYMREVYLYDKFADILDNIAFSERKIEHMYLSASRLLMAAGYEHYEISNFARPGFRSQHNLLYWKNEATIGVGLSAASHVGRRRWKNVRGLLDYMQAIQEGKTSQSENIELSENDQFRENVMLNLRLSEGVPVSVIEQTKIPVIAQFVKEGLATLENNFFRLTPRGWLVSNQLFQYLV
jgi:DNA invertase Pin-like site-specific DNA recombinase